MNTTETPMQTLVTQPATQPAADLPASTTEIVKAPSKRETRIVEDNSPIAYLMDTARFEHCYRIAGAMARASLIPKHLKGDSFEQTQANCFLVVNQALRWQLDPFAIAPETYEVGGKLAYQGKLIAAVINTRAGLAEKLSYEFNGGKGDALSIIVSGRLMGEEKPRTVTLTVGQVKTANQMWTKDPEQKLVYTGSIRWARRHKPEIILGVLTDDDADAIREEMRLIAAKPAKRPDFGPSKALNAPAPAPEHPKGVQTAPGPEKPASDEAGIEATDEKAESEAGLAPAPQKPVGDPVLVILRKLKDCGKTDQDLLTVLRAKKLARPDQKLADLATVKLENIGKTFESAFLPELQKV